MDFLVLQNRSVENLPLTFESEEHYFASFVYPLLEETRADLASSMEIMYRAPFAEILLLNESKCGENMVYDVIAGPWKNQFSERGKDGYCTLPGDLLILVDGKPESISDLQRVGRTWALSLVKSNKNDSTSLKVKASKLIKFKEGMSTRAAIYVLLVMIVFFSQYDPHLFVNLNESQRAAITVALSSRVLRLVRESFKITTASGDYFCPMGDVLLFGTKERLNVSTNIEEIFLEHRGYRACRVPRASDCNYARAHFSQLFKPNMAINSFVLKELYEAAQLKEAESIIPLQLPGLKHAILIGDEHQLPAVVKSNVGIESGLFDRLSSLGHSKHLLNVQYRMHLHQCFPNRWFLSNQSKFKIAQMCISISKQTLTVGVISPYVAQAILIQEKLAHKYEKLDGFSVKVKSVDGFQGGEEDIVILSTVRSNGNGLVGFMSSHQMTNVALKRARHCLWILGNERTLTNSESVRKELVCDARNRHCLFDADADECLKMTIIAAMKELDQLDDLVNENSVLFKHAIWKVLFSDDFRRSFGKLMGSRLKKLVLNRLLKLSSGWRPKNKSVDLCCETSSQILKQFKVEGFYVICTIDIIKEVKYIQVLKVWDILALEEIPKLKKRLEGVYSAYTNDFNNRCTEKCLEGNLEVPRSWPTSQKIIRFRYLSDCEDESKVSVKPNDARNYVENSRISESLLLMKFYSLSRGVVSHLLSDKEVDLPMQVTDEQMDIISSRKSLFINGRSGTGKTTVLTTKLFQHEQKFRIASDGIYEGESMVHWGIRSLIYFLRREKVMMATL
ncbi:UvrD-like helicase, ATP-binding domain, P-loop containing nucleoside triphosphate hydrolase [Tanacetum coccineum]